MDPHLQINNKNSSDLIILKFCFILNFILKRKYFSFLSRYIQGAASAKDIVILLDGSGSMTGLRKEIARNVVLNILDTLSDNDFVTILRVSDN